MPAGQVLDTFEYSMNYFANVDPCFLNRVPLGSFRASLVAQQVKNLPAMQEMRVRSLGRKDLLGEEMVTRSSVLAWRIPMDRGIWWATVQSIAKSWT